MGKIRRDKGKLIVPSNPVIPTIRGDGIGADITPVMIRVIDAVVHHAYGGERKITWKHVIAGEEALEASGLTEEEVEALSIQEKQEIYLPESTIKALSEHMVSIKGPLTTPIGKGFRSLNVAIRQLLSLYACIRPVKWITGVPAPLRDPGKLDVVIFRENTEDVYAGIEWSVESPGAEKLRGLLGELGHRVPQDSAIGIKLISETASKRLVRAAIEYALSEGRRNLTLVHKGNIMKYTEGAFKNWGYEVAIGEYREHFLTEKEYAALKVRRENPDHTIRGLIELLDSYGYDFTEESLSMLIDSLNETHGGANLPEKIIIKDRIADQMFQQLLLRPDEYDVIATMNLNGDYLSDACAAEVGGLGIAPGANINYETGVAVFEATHGSAPRHAGLDKANPGSMILSATMMLRYIGWGEAAELCELALGETIRSRFVTYDLERLMEDATLVSTSKFGELIVENLLRL
jgi:isocitrate dehydrogenase